MYQFALSRWVTEICGLSNNLAHANRFMVIFVALKFVASHLTFTKKLFFNIHCQILSENVTTFRVKFVLNSLKLIRVLAATNIYKCTEWPYVNMNKAVHVMKKNSSQIHTENVL